MLAMQKARGCRYIFFDADDLSCERQREAPQPKAYRHAPIGVPLALRKGRHLFIMIAPSMESRWQ